MSKNEKIKLWKVVSRTIILKHVSQINNIERIYENSICTF
jgi:hypothetical protein